MPERGRPKRTTDIECECAQCGKRYTKPVWSNGGMKYCGRECFYTSRRGRPRTDLQAQPDEKTCPRCSTKFLVGGTGRPQRHTKYCSVDCANKTRGYQPYPRVLSDMEAAWLAGLFDGEGTIVPTKGKKMRDIRMNITNTHLPLLERVLEVTATGRIFDHSKYRTNPKHSRVWHWNCYGTNARELLRQIRPYLIVKAKKADLALSDE